MHDLIRTVHVVAKSHLDLGFTGLAAEVEAQYLTSYVPAAMATAEALRRSGRVERLVWTTGSWILHRALAQVGPPGEAVDAAVRAGDLVWHGWPVTTHTELLDLGLARAAVGISRDLDARFGRSTIAAKMTDVPGHTIGLVPVLAGAGIEFLHLGVNPAWPVPEVPPTFRWEAPDGSSVVVAYQAGGYGGDVVVAGCSEVLAFLHAGDNAGPPTAEEVIAGHAALARRYPGAEIRGSTLDAFTRALGASGAARALPVLRSEIGDPWLFGVGADPQKVAGYRGVLADRREVAADLDPADLEAIDRTLLLVAEHTWGLDQKEALPDTTLWDRGGLGELRATPACARFEASWAEQRSYVAVARRLLGEAAERAGAPLPDRSALTLAAVAEVGDDPAAAGWSTIDADARHLGPCAGWEIQLDGGTGAVIGLATPQGRVLADASHPLGLLTYESFDAVAYERFYADLVPLPEDEAWARWDNTKPGIEAAGAVAGRWSPTATGTWVREDGDQTELLVRAAWTGRPASRLGAPAEIWTRWSFGRAPGGAVITVAWRDKPACRLPEALWCTFSPVVADPTAWRIDKLGVAVDPFDVVARGGRSLHAAGEGLHYRGGDGPLWLDLLDAPLVAPGAPNLLDADPPAPDLVGGWHVLLMDNCWGTNFPMWSEGDASFAFRLTVR